MIKSTAFLPATLLSVLLFLFVSCQKEESDTLTDTEEEQAAIAAATAEAEMEFAVNDIFDNVIGVNAELGIPGTGIFGKIIDRYGQARTDSTRCFNITISPLQPGVFPKTVTIDFGNGCSSLGHTRSGKITTVYTGRLILPGSSATTSFENYKIDHIAVEGTHKITNTTPLGTLQKQFQVDITDAKLSKPDGNYITWNSHRVKKQIEGNGTETNKDDIFSISGHSKGRVKTGDFIFAWNAEIVEPLMKKFTCRWIVKGQIRVLRETLPSNSQWRATLDYGAGQCDNKAVVTVNGQAREISLR